jgi:hypothetical protein
MSISSKSKELFSLTGDFICIKPKKTFSPVLLKKAGLDRKNAVTGNSIDRTNQWRSRLLARIMKSEDFRAYRRQRLIVTGPEFARRADGARDLHKAAQSPTVVAHRNHPTIVRAIIFPGLVENTAAWRYT